ncbi:MSHA biogenesis protein MshQ, partial [Vibrio parahaemolyticus]|nr:MSHA biogenesis protein MshQ [Vibrio parahaemolyticus]
PALPVDLNNMGTCGYGVFIGNQNQYVDIPHNQQLSFSERLTVSAWVYPVSRPTGDGLHTIVAKDDNYEFHLDSQGRVYWYWATSNNNANSLRTTQSIPLNTWSHITIRYDRNLSGNQRQRIYINGVAVASNNDSRALRTNTLNLEIGRDFNFDSRSFNGRIDEVTIYGSALTDEQILSLYNQRHSCGGDIPQCFSDDFNRPNLEQDWVPFTSSGNFTPRVVSNRLRLTEAIGNQATAVTYQRIFPAANNLVQVELDYYAWANLTGNGADGVSLIFSDATVTPRTGGFGGSLGYAQRTDTNPNTPGFAGGWLGIGLDEWGNFANPTEGRVGGVGFRPQSITVRGSQASNYRYLTHQTVSPNIDTRNTNTPAPGDRYLIEIDSRNANPVLLSIRRTRNN